MRVWKSSNPVRKLLAVGFTAALLATACGGGGETTDDETTPDAEPTSEMTETETEPPMEDCEPGECEPPADILAAAQEEGQVVMYTSIAAPTLDAFNEDLKELYGIELVYTEMAAAESLERARAEFDSGNVSSDILPLGDPADFSDWNGDGMLLELTEADIPNLAVYADQQDLFRENAFFYWGGVAYTLGYNTEAIPEGAETPTNYCELTDPVWEGRVGVTYQEGANSMAHMWKIQDICGDDFWPDMIENGLVRYAGTSEGVAALAAGEVAAHLSVVTYILDGQKANGAPVDWTLPEEGFTISTRWSAAMADAPNPNAAKVFINYLLSKRGQQVAFGNQYGVPVVPGVEDTLQAPNPDNVLYAERTNARELQEEIIPHFS